MKVLPRLFMNPRLRMIDYNEETCCLEIPKGTHIKFKAEMINNLYELWGSENTNQCSHSSSSSTVLFQCTSAVSNYPLCVICYDILKFEI